jgi:hypothetical protein
MRKTLLAITLAFLLSPLAGHAIAPPWTAAGTTGSIYPGNFWVSYNSLSGGSITQGVFLTLNNGGITFSSGYTGTGGPFPIFYNVTSPQAAPGWTSLEMGYTGVTTSGAYISTSLYQVDPNTGAKTLLCNVGSPVGSTYQGCNFTTAMNFNNYAYYVEVDLSRTSKTQSPQINYLKIH